MTTARRPRLALMPAGLFLAALVLAWSWPGGLELSFTPVTGGPSLLTLPMRPGERFTIRYMHSVDHSPVWEEHSVDEGGRIFIEEERLIMFGAGMGEFPGRGRLTSRDGRQVIENIHALLGDFVLRVGSPGVDHTVLWRGQAVNLSRLAAGQAVRVAARTVGLLGVLLRRLGPGAVPPATAGEPGQPDKS